MSQVTTWPNGQLQALLKVEERYGTMLELGSHDAGCAESKSITIKRNRTLQIVYTQCNHRDPGFSRRILLRDPNA